MARFNAHKLPILDGVSSKETRFLFLSLGGLSLGVMAIFAAIFVAEEMIENKMTPRDLVAQVASEVGRAVTSDVEDAPFWSRLSTAETTGSPFNPTRRGKMHIGPASIGESVQTFLERNPGASLRRAGNGSRVALVNDPTGAFAVSFLSDHDGGQAFRVRYENTFKELSEEDLMGRLSAKFGAPLTSKCVRRTYREGRQCDLSWRSQKAVRVSANLHTVAVAHGERRETRLQLEAVDTALEQRLRSGRVGFQEPAKTVERLPF